MTTLLNPARHFHPANSIAWGNIWRADNAVTLSGSPASDGGAVDSWADFKSALAMTNATGAQRPLYRASSSNFNGMPCLEFDGTNDRLFVNGTPSANAQPNTVICVFKMLALPGSGALASITDNDSGNRHSIYVNGTGPGISGYAGTVSSSGITADTNLHLAMFDANGSSSVIQVDGTVSSTFAANSQNLRGFYVGAAPGASGTQAANVQIAMVGWFDGILPDSDKAALRGWCRSYYGTP